MKIKNIFIVIILNYLLITVVATFSEMWFMSDKVQHIQNIMTTAGDMALEQTQVTDDFFTKAGYHMTSNGYNITMPGTDGKYKSVPMYTGLYGVSSTSNDSKATIYNKIYNTSDFKNFSKKLGNVRVPVRFWNSAKTGLNWYYIPKISQIGTAMLPSDNNTTGIKSSAGNYINRGLANELFAMYRYVNPVKTSAGKSYCVTPLSIGVTYLNKDMLGTLFMNNMDLLMRTKYSAMGYSLNSARGGKGLLKGETYSSLVSNSVDNKNPINDGVFTLVRGARKTDSGSGVLAYKGITPKIEYKVIDMYDSRNDAILSMLFGANKGTYGSKASYLKSLDTAINPVTGIKYSSKMIVVAKVTFSADVIVPYSTLPIRDLRGNMGGSSNNYLDIRRNSRNARGSSGNTVMTYTRYFAVTP